MKPMDKGHYGWVGSPPPLYPIDGAQRHYGRIIGEEQIVPAQPEFSLSTEPLSVESLLGRWQKALLKAKTPCCGASVEDSATRSLDWVPRQKFSSSINAISIRVQAVCTCQQCHEQLPMAMYEVHTIDQLRAEMPEWRQDQTLRA